MRPLIRVGLLLSVGSPPCAWGKRPPTAPGSPASSIRSAPEHYPNRSPRQRRAGQRGQGNGSATIKMSEDFSSGGANSGVGYFNIGSLTASTPLSKSTSTRISRRSMDWRTRRHWSSSIQGCARRPSDSKLRVTDPICAHARYRFSAANRR